MRMMILVPGLPVDIQNIKGGVNSATINLLFGFVHEKIEVCVISFSKEVSSLITFRFSNHILIKYIPEGYFKFHTFNYLFCIPQQLKKEIKSFKPDLIHYQVGNSFLLTKLRSFKKIKLVLTIHGNSFKEGKIKRKWTEKMTWMFNGLMQEIMFPKYIIHLSEHSKKQIGKKNVNNNTIIPNAIKDDYFKIPMKKKTDNIILYVGVIDKNKNLIYLLTTLNNLIKKGYRYSLVILGGFLDEVYKSKILTFIKANNISGFVHFKGWVKQFEIMKIMGNSDIVVVSSFYESLPMVIAESMAAGKIVIANSVGGIPDMIKDSKTGYLFNIRSPIMLENILIELYNNDHPFQFISENAREFAKKTFECKIVAKKTIEFYQTILND